LKETTQEAIDSSPAVFAWTKATEDAATVSFSTVPAWLGNFASLLPAYLESMKVQRRIFSLPEGPKEFRLLVWLANYFDNALFRIGYVFGSSAFTFLWYDHFA
jgi:hypothetical protein